MINSRYCQREIILLPKKNWRAISIYRMCAINCSFTTSLQLCFPKDKSYVNSPFHCNKYTYNLHRLSVYDILSYRRLIVLVLTVNCELPVCFDGAAPDVCVLRPAGDVLEVVGGLRVETDHRRGHSVAVAVVGELDKKKGKYISNKIVLETQ